MPAWDACRACRLPLPVNLSCLTVRFAAVAGICKELWTLARCPGLPPARSATLVHFPPPTCSPYSASLHSRPSRRLIGSIPPLCRPFIAGMLAAHAAPLACLFTLRSWLSTVRQTGCSPTASRRTSPTRWVLTPWCIRCALLWAGQCNVSMAGRRTASRPMSRTSKLLPACLRNVTPAGFAPLSGLRHALSCHSARAQPLPPPVLPSTCAGGHRRHAPVQAYLDVPAHAALAFFQLI